jgi:hypothetical protein
MPAPKPTLDRTRRRALTVLAGSPDGATEAVMLAHGFKLALLVELIRDGLVSASVDRMMAGSKALEVTRLRITEAGREALS